MKVMDSILARARANPARIVLPEGEDPRIIEGALKAHAEGVARPILLGDPEIVRDHARSSGNASTIEVIDPSTFSKKTHYAEQYAKYRVMNATGTLLDALLVDTPEEWSERVEY